MKSRFHSLVTDSWKKLPVSFLVAAAALSFGALDAQKPELMRSVEGHKGGTHTLQFSPDGSQILTAGEDGKIHTWNLITGDKTQKIRKNRRGTFEAAFTPDGMHLITSGKRSPVEVYEVGGSRLQSLEGTEADQIALAVSQDGAYIATAGVDHEVRIWMRLSEEPLHVLNDCTAPITDIAFDSTSQMMAVSSLDGRLRVYDLQSGYLAREIDLKAPLHAVHFDPTSKRVAVAAGEELKLIDVGNPEKVITIRGHKGQIVSLDYSPNGLFVLTGSTDKTARIWSTITGRELATLVQQDGVISAVAFDPMGKTIATASKPYLHEDNKMVGDTYVAMYDMSDIYSDHRISSVVEKEMYHWQKKGEFEKMKDFQARLATKPQQTGAIFARVYKQYAQEIAEEAMLSAYNPEKEQFTVTLPVLGSFVLDVPIEKAKAFKKNFKKAIYRNFVVVPNIVVPNKSTWKLKALEVYLPSERESYFYGDANATAKPMKLREKGF